MKRKLTTLALLITSLIAYSQCEHTLLDAYVDMCRKDSVCIDVRGAEINWKGMSSKALTSQELADKYNGYVNTFMEAVRVNSLINDRSIDWVCNKDTNTLIWIKRKPTLEGYLEWKLRVIK